MKPKQHYYIVAENYDHYHNWVQSGRPKELIEDWENAAFIFVYYPEQLRGMTDIEGFFLPGCERNPEYQGIKNLITTIKHFANTPVTINHTPTGSTIFGKQITGIILDELFEDKTK